MADGEDKNADNLQELIECFETQLMEIEVIQSIFAGENEFEIENKQTFEQMAAICEKFRSSNSENDVCGVLLKQISYLQCIALDFQLKKDETLLDNVNVNISLPSRYPLEHPIVFISSNGLSREEQGLWNTKLDEYLNGIITGEQAIFQIIEWLKETSRNYFKDSNSEERQQDHKCDNHNLDNVPALGSMWLYMHHIYNKEKRKNIIYWANELQLTGFSLPGKPGVVHVEGDVENIDEYFMRLRRLSWKRMSCVHRESYPESNCIKRKFTTFEELSFDAHGGRDYHMDMGKFQQFLKNHDLGDMFRILFGIKD